MDPALSSLLVCILGRNRLHLRAHESLDDERRVRDLYPRKLGRSRCAAPVCVECAWGRESEVPKEIPNYETPADYLASNHRQVVEHPWLDQAKTETRHLIEEFTKPFRMVESMMDILGHWSGDVMHGDLWIPNIVFRQSQEVLLLDFDACAIGDSRYDLSYLLEGKRIDNIPDLIPDEDLIIVNKLRPLVLCYIIGWSIERLLSMESGIVEPNLNTPRIRKELLGYVESNITRLKTHLIN